MKRHVWISSLILALVVALVFARTPAAAHHSSAPFYDDTKRVQAVGTVSRFLFRNPHSFIFIQGDNGRGQSVEWEVELGAAVSMRRSGWTPETIKAGDPIRAVGQPSRAPDTWGMCCAELSRPDGSPIRPSR